MANTVVAIISDTHIGSHTALSTLTFTNDDGQETKSSRAQEWIYNAWMDYWNYVKTLAGVVGNSRKSRIVMIHLGDIIDGAHHNGTQFLPNVKDQETMACELLLPIANLADGGLFICRGTEAHAGDAAQSEVRIAQELGAKACEWSLVLNIDGIIIDCAHHGRVGRRDWTSSAANMAVEIAMDYQRNGEHCPRYVFRGHNHLIDDSGEKLANIRAICLPSWQLRTAFGYRVSPNRRSDIGGLVMNTDNPEYIDFNRARYKAAPGQRRIIKV